nr:amino acid permease [Spirosomataceae bacterium]
MKLQKQITLYSLIMIAIGSSIGSGIFKTPSEIAGYLPSEGWMLSVWVVGGLVSLCGALTFAEISSSFPKAGGFYVFIKEAFGQMPAFLYGWSMLLVINTGSLAALSLVFVSYLNTLIPLSENAQLIIAVLAITLLTVMNVIGVKFGSLFASIFTSAKLLGILIIILLGVFYGIYDTNAFNFTWNDASSKTLTSSFGLALIGVTFSYEVKDAQRIVPRAMLIGILVVCLAYLTINLSYLKLYPISKIISSNSVAADSISTFWDFGAKFVAFLIVLSVLGTIGIYILTAPRIYFAMAEDGIFFKKFAEIHPKYKTPFWAIIFQSVWTIFLL